jgi:hypothetical protein
MKPDCFPAPPTSIAGDGRAAAGRDWDIRQRDRRLRAPVRVLFWNRLGYLFRSRSFSWVWKRDGNDTASICVESGRDSVTLKYYFRSYGGERSDVSHDVSLDWVPYRFGGERPWFVCPGLQNGRSCGRRVRYLYGAGKLFACRHCYGLAYESDADPRRGSRRNSLRNGRLPRACERKRTQWISRRRAPQSAGA